MHKSFQVICIILLCLTSSYFQVNLKVWTVSLKFTRATLLRFIKSLFTSSQYLLKQLKHLQLKPAHVYWSLSFDTLLESHSSVGNDGTALYIPKAKNKTPNSHCIWNELLQELSFVLSSHWNFLMLCKIMAILNVGQKLVL